MAAGGRDNADALLVIAFARGLTVEEAATDAGVSERTAYRRKADPEFRRRVADAQREAVAQAVGVIADGTLEAARVLRDLAQHGPPAVRLGAARTLLGLYAPVSDKHHLEAQVADLAREIAELKKGR
jgi:hypothetical protein